jgi:hypothetical protein
VTTLPLSFERYGYQFEQVERTTKHAIYSQCREGKVAAYEVVRIRVAPASEVFGAAYPEREVYPGSEAWGSEGWTCMDLESARERAIVR